MQQSKNPFLTTRPPRPTIRCNPARTLVLTGTYWPDPPYAVDLVGCIMKSFSLRTLFAVLISCAVAFAQAGKPSSGGGGSTGTGTRSTPTPTITPTTPSRTIPPYQQPQTPIFLTGNVVMDDGTPPTDRVSIERICNGRATREAYTDSRGYFSFSIGGPTMNTMPQDASESGNPGIDTPGIFPSSAGLGGAPGGTTQNLQQALIGCELRASMPGTLSGMIELADHVMSNMSDPNVGTLVLHRIGKVDGSSISITSLKAPKGARKAFDRGSKELKKDQYDKAKADFTLAVGAYPDYAEAWAKLAQVLLHDKEYANAISASQKSIAADNHFVEPYFSLIAASADQNDWKATASYSDTLLSLDGYHYPAAYYYNALAYMELNNLEKAQNSIVAARKYDLNSSLPKAVLLMGEIMMRRENYTEAVKAYKAYLERFPSGPSSEFARNQLNAAQTKLAAATPPVNPAKP